MPFESHGVPHPASRAGPALRHNYQEATGVIHIHSTYSDGQLPVESIARIAQEEGLDYLLITDHDTLQARRDGKEGFYGKTLVLIGEEISTSGGHYLGLRLSKEVPSHQDPQWTVEAVSAQGGLGFIAHPFWARRPWLTPHVRGFTGLEIYNAADGITRHYFLWLGLWTIFTGSEFSIVQWLDRTPEPLEMWDRAVSTGERVVGIGAADAHGLKRFGLRLGPYATLFKFIRTHLLVRELSESAVYEALQSGHCFAAHDIVADARGFSFVAARRGDVDGIMGDQVKRRTGLKLYAYLPSPGSIALFKDGRLLLQTQGQHAWLDVKEPGVYRVEAFKGGKPWIYGNPIYVVE